MADRTLIKTATKARILLVDSDRIMLASLTSFLEAEGYEVTTVESVKRAIDCLDAGLYSLLITEVDMPQGDGFELLRHVRRSHKDVEVIFVTGYGTVE
ncbi:MAG: response regulator, partial [Phycisphaerae bacterium]|nr:response regulator [Phycisphaerae bacterium]